MLAANTFESLSNETDVNASLGNEKDYTFKRLFRGCIYGICLRLKQPVLATHRELSVLRRCAEMLREKSPRFIHVVANANTKKTKFIVNTLMHLGVSCGKIKVSAAESSQNGGQDVWIFVTDS